MPTENAITPEERIVCAALLQRIADDPSMIQGDERLKALIAKIHRTGKKGERHGYQQVRRGEDKAVKQSTAMVQRDLLQKSLAVVSDAAGSAGNLHRPVRCYRCKQSFTQVHFFYHWLCPDCATLCYAKREQRAGLSGRTALITGGRLKIGYQMALRMLRDGARVIVMTRFPADAEKRFAAEEDFGDWQSRLVIYGLDLRHLPSVEAFVRYLDETESHLDILVNHAAQTVKRPLAFYAHLLEAESAALSPGKLPVLLEARRDYPDPDSPDSLLLAGASETLFPLTERDAYGQPLDKRSANSWSLTLSEIGTLEMMEVQLVNAIAPFLLCGQLKPLFLRSPHTRRFIVNVSATEGQFVRDSKSARHPHTNMAKAALNMLTRTSASEYALDGIYMNSVDTGWVSNESPYKHRVRQQEKSGLYLPLDALDGAARLYDPIAQGIEKPEEPVFGQFLKDFAPSPW